MPEKKKSPDKITSLNRSILLGTYEPTEEELEELARQGAESLRKQYESSEENEEEPKEDK